MAIQVDIQVDFCMAYTPMLISMTWTLTLKTFERLILLVLFYPILKTRPPTRHSLEIGWSGDFSRVDGENG